MVTTYYRDDESVPHTLLRKTALAEEAFVNGRWGPTRRVNAWMYGQYNTLDIISEAVARAEFPAAAFSTEPPALNP